MLSQTEPVPRLVNDTYRTMVTLGVLMAASLVAGIGYGLAATRYGLPLGDLTYYTGWTLSGFVLYFVFYQLLTWRTLRRADGEQLEAWARASTPRSRRERRLQTWTGSGVLSWAVTAAILALSAVVAVLLVPELRDSLVILVTSLLVVASCWSMVGYTFAVAYLRLNADHGGLDFPGTARPVWADYVYLAVQVNATFSSSDVDVTSAKARRLVTVHTLLAFVFNTVIVALLVSALVTLAG